MYGSKYLQGLLQKLTELLWVGLIGLKPELGEGLTGLRYLFLTERVGVEDSGCIK